MHYFVFRNMTIENPMGQALSAIGGEASYSGYEDISAIAEADKYIWWYLAPYKAETAVAAEEIGNYTSLLALVLKQIPAEKTVIAFTIEPFFEVNCITGKDLLKSAIETYNAKLYELAGQYSNLRIFDFSSFTRNYSLTQLVDWKYYFISQMAFNPRLSRDFSTWFSGQVKAMNSDRKKCLVLDMDNTLWGGIVGEAGPFGIKIGGDYPGKAYLYFQQYILELQRNGVILAVCSKNNLEDIKQVWDENPNNLITEQVLSAYRINWQDKAANIREIAAELNIGLDSMVFLDDNPSERELVRGMLPEVEVPDFPAQPYELPSLIQQITRDYFQIYSLTSEDISKTSQYKANAQRENARKSFTDMESYLRSLEITLKIEDASPVNIPRLAQMCQKTNQFNLTTKRYTESDIESLIVNGVRIWALSVSDRFGDHGITGLIIVRTDGKRAVIDSLLLSCRILGKGIEHIFLEEILSRLKSAGIEIVEGCYIPTAKNIQTADFYEKSGFVNGILPLSPWIRKEQTIYRIL